MSAPALSKYTKFLELEEFVLESGERIAPVQIAYRTWGTLSEGRDNAVLVLHALTGDANADLWWRDMFAPPCAGRSPLHAFDLYEDFIVSSNVLGSVYGTTGPLSLDEHGDAYRGSFPRFTVRDIVNLQYELVKSLGIERIKLVVGGSLGGMQVLEWAATYPELVEAIAAIAVSGRHSAWTIGISEAQRQAIYADPNWRGGFYSDGARPSAGLQSARAFAMLTYRSWQSLEERFGRNEHPAGDFEVSHYLRHQGVKLDERFDAVSYVRLTEAMDSHDLSRGRGEYEEVLRSIDVPALIVGISSDILYPPHEQRELARLLPNARYVELESPHGHDAFLIDVKRLSAIVASFRASLREERRVSHERSASVA